MTENRKHLPEPSREAEHEPLPLTDEDGDVREMTEEDFRAFRPTHEVAPDAAALWEKARGQRGPQKSPVKERVGLRLDKHVIEHFRQTGPGWQSRINEVLADYVKAGRG